MREILELFNHLPMVVLWIKDTEGVFVHCNRRFEEMHKLEPGGWKGKTDYDLHPAVVASGYVAEDERVMGVGIVVPNQLWMVPDGGGLLHWWNSTKVPLRDENGVITGVGGAMYRVSDATGIMAPYERVEEALKIIHMRYSEPLRTEELAQASNLSVSQFNRVFREIMEQSPKMYLNRLRLNEAKEILVKTNQTVSEIALEVGFYDGSEFGKRFREAEGVTPRQYRLKLRAMSATGGGESLL